VQVEAALALRLDLFDGERMGFSIGILANASDLPGDLARNDG